MDKKKEIKIGNFKLKKRYVTSTIGIILLILAVCVYVNSLLYQSTDDAYVEAHLAQIAPRVAGQVTEVYINDNQKIKEGDVVIKIDDTDYKVKLAQAEANYQKALLNQKVASANLNASNSEIDLAKRDLDRYQKLYNSMYSCYPKLKIIEDEFGNSEFQQGYKTYII